MNMEAKDFKHGMKVTCEINGDRIDDAVLSQDNDGCWFICQNTKTGSVAEDRMGYKYSWAISVGGVVNLSHTHMKVTNLQPVKKQRKPKPKEEVSIVYDGVKYDGSDEGMIYSEAIKSANDYFAEANKLRAQANRWLKYAKRYGWEVK